MNRRAFFGFACGGAVAAPMALVGEKAMPINAVSELIPGAEARTVVVSIDGASGDALIRQLVQRGVSEAMHDFSQRQSRHESRRA